MHTAKQLDSAPHLVSKIVPLHGARHPLTQRVLDLPEDVIAEFLEEDDCPVMDPDDLPDHHVLCPGEESHTLLTIAEFVRDFRELRQIEAEHHNAPAIDLEIAILAFCHDDDRDAVTAAARHPAIMAIYLLLRALQRHVEMRHAAGLAGVLADLKRMRVEQAAA